MSVVKKLNSISFDAFPVEQGSCTGVLVGVNESGRPLVTFSAFGATVVEARSVLSREDCADIREFPVDVTLIFECNDRYRPVIVGVIREKLFPIGSTLCSQNGHVAIEASDSIGAPEMQVFHPRYEADIDGQRVTISGRDEIKLQCGKSSILLRKDGKIVIKGSNLISRSTATNKIKGGSVSIN